MSVLLYTRFKNSESRCYYQPYKWTKAKNRWKLSTIYDKTHNMCGGQEQPSMTLKI